MISKVRGNRWPAVAAVPVMALGLTLVIAPERTQAVMRPRWRTQNAQAARC